MKMTTINIQIPMIDRKTEFADLKSHLNNATKGQGNLLFIEGEAGIGKTRLLDELKSYARSQGINILQGGSMYESLTPYMPFVDALRSANLDHLFSREASPKVECVYLISNTGLLIKDVIREKTELDSTIFAGMLTAVGEFVKDSLSLLSGEDKKEALNSLGYENYRILIESSRSMNLVVIITGRENEFLINDIKETLFNVEEQFGGLLKVWNGDDKSLEGIQNLLEPLITSGKYDGIDYAKDDPKIKRNRLFENILLGLIRYTKVNPSLLCIEDLQWADPSTLALMHYVARNTKKCNLLILGTYRPEDVTVTKEGKVHHLIETMQLMSHEDLCKRIQLERLKENHILEMLNSLLGKNALTNGFISHLFKETEGNPFFILELLKMLAEERTIEKKDDVWILMKNLKDANIPSKVNDVIVRRLSRVNEGEREILDYAAVIGEEFTSGILARAIKMDKIHLLRQLRTLEQEYKLIRSFETKFKFDHGMIKEVLYNKIPVELRMEYHAIIADAIETKNKDDLDEVIGDLAFHYYHCKNRKKASPYLIKAAEKAMKDYSNEEAIRFYSEALELEEDSQKRIKVFEALGDIFELIGNYDKSIESYKRALELIPKTKKMAEIKAKIGRIYLRKGEHDESSRNCTEALNLVKDEECKEKALAINNIGNIHWLKGEYDKAFECYEESLKIRYKINDKQGIATSLHNIGLMYFWRENYDRAIEYVKRSLMICEREDNLYSLAYTLLNLGYIFEHMEEYDEAFDKYEKSKKISEKIGSIRELCWYYCRSANVNFRKGNFKKAFEFCNKTFELSNKIGAEESIGASKGVLGMIYREQKRWKESIENFEYNIKILQEIGDNWHLGDSYYEFGLMWREKGDTEKAKEYLNKALDINEDLKLEEHVKKVKEALQTL
jgi:predicted ATPase